MSGKSARGDDQLQRQARSSAQRSMPSSTRFRLGGQRENGGLLAGTDTASKRRLKIGGRHVRCEREEDEERLGVEAPRNRFA